ncbi:MAG: flagellar hook capping FlgD N-terminal domain-containing protein [Vampirovibrionales bacterium]
MMITASSLSEQLTNINSNTNIVNQTASSKDGGAKTMDNQAFMRLMMAQLQNQNPLSPTDNSAFVQQQASYAQVEETRNLAAALKGSTQLQQASDIVGKTVSYLRSGDKSLTTGVVKSATINQGGIELEIGTQGDKVMFDKVDSIQVSLPSKS